MNQHFGLPMIAVVVASIVNICLMATAAFYPERTASYVVVPMLRVKLGYVAVSLGLCSQVLYCLMLVTLKYSWIALHQGYDSISYLEASLSRTGALLSAATVLAALFGRGLRRWAGVWVAATTYLLWGLAGLNAGIGEGLNGLIRALLGGR